MHYTVDQRKDDSAGRSRTKTLYQGNSIDEARRIKKENDSTDKIIRIYKAVGLCGFEEIS